MKHRLFSESGMGSNCHKSRHLHSLVEDMMQKIIEYSNVENIDIRDVQVICVTKINYEIARHILKK